MKPIIPKNLTVNTMLKLNRLKQYFRYISVLFFIGPVLCDAFEYSNNQIAIKLKSIDMEYGERLTSLEQVRQNPDNSIMDLKGVMEPEGRPKMRCTTEIPIPSIDPDFVPSSSSECMDNEIDVDDGNRDDSWAKVLTASKSALPFYKAPPSPAVKPFYIDDN